MIMLAGGWHVHSRVRPFRGRISHRSLAAIIGGWAGFSQTESGRLAHNGVLLCEFH